GIDDDAVGDDRLQMRVQHPGREQRELVRLVAAHHRMAGIGAAVVADDEIMLGGEQIDDFPFGLVAPLQADYAGAGHAFLYLVRDGRWWGLEAAKRGASRFGPLLDRLCSGLEWT